MPAGLGADHVREQDGLWAVLAWLSILAYKNKDVPVGEPLVGVQDVCKAHWAKYGRHFTARHEYAGVDGISAGKVLSGLVEQFEDLTGREFGNEEATGGALFTIATADEYAYEHLGVRLSAADNTARLVFALADATEEAATVQVFVEKYLPAPEVDEEAAAAAAAADPDPDAPPSPLEASASEFLAPLVAIALEVGKIAELVGAD
eukprot:SAG22_NODE_6033_length_912_cov_1.277983_1_plen_204_part_10